MQSEGEKTITPSELAKAVDISLPYASQLLSEKRPIPQGLAIKIFRATGLKFGVIAEATAEEIAVLERFQASA